MFNVEITVTFASILFAARQIAESEIANPKYTEEYQRELRQFLAAIKPVLEKQSW